MLDNLEDGELCSALPKPVNLARRGNRARQKFRPQDATDLSFSLSFVKDDVVLDGGRHIIFASDLML